MASRPTRAAPAGGRRDRACRLSAVVSGQPAFRMPQRALADCCEWVALGATAGVGAVGVLASASLLVGRAAPRRPLGGTRWRRG
jgi:hypothetical protein